MYLLCIHSLYSAFSLVPKKKKNRSKKNPKNNNLRLTDVKKPLTHLTNKKKEAKIELVLNYALKCPFVGEKLLFAQNVCMTQSLNT